MNLKFPAFRLPSCEVIGSSSLKGMGGRIARRAFQQPHTIYAIGSLSKQFTAAAIMKLYEEDRLQLDEPVTKYLPEYQATQTSVPTIRNLPSQNRRRIP